MRGDSPISGAQIAVSVWVASFRRFAIRNCGRDAIELLVAATVAIDITGDNDNTIAC
jgi:hypothetical protein